MVGGLTVAGGRKLAGLVVVVMFLLGCVVAQAANASVLGWQLNGMPVEEAVGVKTTGTLKFTDKNAGIFGEKITVECKVTGEGAVGLGTDGEVGKWTATGCVNATPGAICVEPSVTVKKLPWHTELSEVEGKVRDAISTVGSGTPEFEIVCPTIVEDTCSENMSTAVENVSGGVDMVFDSKSGKLNCTRGGTGSGSIEGTELVENPTKGTLTAAYGPPLQTWGWHLRGYLMEHGEKVATAMSGKNFSFSRHALIGNVQIKCNNVAGKEMVGPRVEGEVTEWTTTGCETISGACPYPSIKALHLPWHTELYKVGEEIRDSIVEGGTGKPEYEVLCAGSYEYQCNLNASSRLTNAVHEEEGVLGEFQESEERTCSNGSARMSGSYHTMDTEGRLLTVE